MKLWYSIAEVAALLRVSRWTARRRVRSGQVPGGELMYEHEKGERWHVRAEVFEAWRRKIAPDAPDAPNLHPVRVRE